jgi:hypothetical protein
MKDSIRLVKYLQSTAKIILFVVAVFWFVFALISGSAEYGGGVKGIVRNSPNALPWLLLLFIVYVAWRRELFGGTLVTVMGLCTIFWFDTFESPFIFFVLSIPLILLGGFLITSWFVVKKKV